MTYFGRPRPTRPNIYDTYLNKWARINTLVPKRMYMLMFMIDGFDDTPPWYGSRHWSDKRGGTGSASLNCLGGFGYDATVRRMVRDGEIVLSRHVSHSNAFDGNPTINRTRVTVTDKGRAVYAAWKRRSAKKIGLDS